jgi:uncharacterized caspase-like protein
MTRNWAIAIGVSQYDSQYLSPLPSAQRDAEDIRKVFQSTKINFEQVYCFTQNSPDIVLPDSNIVLSTQPTYRNLSDFFELRFREPFLSIGDNFWFFFSGRGMYDADRHYLLPQDGNILALARTAFAVSDICNYLQCSGADNIILLLDAEHSRDNRDASVIEPEIYPGVVSILACHPMQPSYNRNDLEHGMFASGLLTVLQSQGHSILVDSNYTIERKQYVVTPEQLCQHLRDLMPEVSQWIRRRPAPQPHITAEPPERLHYILFPKLAQSRDIALLKQNAYRCIQQGLLTLAEQICQRIRIALKPRSSMLDLDLARLQQTIQQMRSTPQTLPVLSNEEFSDRTIPLLSLILEDSLASDSDIDYQPLRDLLIAGQWQAANDETRRLMRQAVEREAGDFPTLAEMEQNLQNLLNNPLDDVAPEIRDVLQVLLQNIQQVEPNEQVSLAALFIRTFFQTQQTEVTPENQAAFEFFVGSVELAHRDEAEKHFPFTNLFTLDHLWVKYSRGKFGFSIQKCTYFACGGTDSDTHNPDAWDQFVDRVGWRVNGEWLSGDRNLITDTAPDGYFPIPNFSNSVETVEFWSWWQLVQDA